MLDLQIIYLIVSIALIILPIVFFIRRSRRKVWLIKKGRETRHFTISEAMNLSEPGDTVELGPGTYTEKVTVAEGVTLRPRNLL